ncbi:hypothetical protein PG990_006424 [Apiospora arundinis]|uniref:Uncharacterized protein n=1 Tax=Apiospora arundinis TaxID=335852 RepID=A0ABR2JBN9_9PEZI
MSSSASAFAKTLPQSLSSRTVLVKCTPAPQSLAERRAILQGLKMTGLQPEIEVFRKLEGAADASSFIAITATPATASNLVHDSPFRRVMIRAPYEAGPAAQAMAAWGGATATATDPHQSGGAAAATTGRVAEPVVVQAPLKVDPAKKPWWWRKAQKEKMKKVQQELIAAVEGEGPSTSSSSEQPQQLQDPESGDAAAANSSSSKAAGSEKEGLSIQRKEFTIHVFPANKDFKHQRMVGRGLLHGPWPLVEHNVDASAPEGQATVRDTFVSASLRRSVPHGRLAPALRDWDTGRQMAVGRGTAAVFDDRPAWELIGAGFHGQAFVQHRMRQREIARKIPAVMRSLVEASRRGQRLGLGLGQEQQQQPQQHEQQNQRRSSLDRWDDEMREANYGQGNEQG